MPEVYILIPSYRYEDLFDRVLATTRISGVPHSLLVDKRSAGIPNEGVPKVSNKLMRWALEDEEVKYIMTIHNDFSLKEPGWLAKLITLLEAMPEDIGSLSPSAFENDHEAYPGQWCTITRDGTARWFLDSEPYWNTAEWQELHWGYQCALSKADVIRKIGYLDDVGYGLGSYEGLEYGIRMIRHGYRNVTTGRIKCYHDQVEGNTSRMGSEYLQSHYDGGKYLHEKNKDFLPGMTVEQAMKTLWRTAR